MKSSAIRSLVVVVSLLLALVACKGREKAISGAENSETIAPAQPQPQPTGTDAMTQTVDVEDSRTDGESGTATTTDTAAASAVTTGTTPPPSTTTR